MVTQLSKQRAEELIRSMRDRKIVVLGDVMLDEFIWGDVTRISPEAPVPVVDIRRESVHLGGAANVLANLVGLGAKACVVGVIGNDSAGCLPANTSAYRSQDSKLFPLPPGIIDHAEPSRSAKNG